MTITTCVFDAYGTLFDVTSAARSAASEPGHEELAALWPKLAEDWRRKQLEYSWLRAITGAHADFWAVTEDALDWAMEASALTDPALRVRLMDLYAELQAYPEVPTILEALKSQGYATAILSNGSPQMLAAAVTSAGLVTHLDAVLSVESCGIFKPAPQVYDLVGQHFGCANDQVLFVSSNGWDAGCATGYGFITAWVNRAGAPVDRLPWRPSHTLANLTPIPSLARSL
ncbi:MAG: haloacid dehalogenase type II [Paracoccaceae bacterium]|nr:haloacid dehalogenase type II [Paracoccaceae bacterium]